ncbi:hypothetical protein [Pseudoduganella sp. RAF53_2]|uniref:hypothetical protein n=1 Tax=unclassified Pseudoduganella TaxID=2637179 RepID=UPI003F9640AB
MYSLPEEFSRAAMAAFNAQMANFDAYAQAAMDAALSSLASATVASNQFLAMQNPEDLLDLATSQSQQAFGLAQAYSREATDAALNKPLFR